MRLLLLLLSALPLVAEPVPLDGRTRPNVVLIMTDDMGAETVGCYGGVDYRTPNLDRLAARGIRFRHCYSQPLCTPSRVKIMTGKSNARNYTDFGELDPSETTSGHRMREAGYATGVFGKWQLGGKAAEVAARGYDRHTLWHIEGRPSRYWQPGLIRDGVRLEEEIADRFGPDVVLEDALAWIAEVEDRPFFLYYPMILPHWPFVPTPDSEPGGGRERLGRYDGREGGEEYFDDMVAYVDTLLGRLIEGLESQGVAENTLIFFTCDNGTATNVVSRIPGGEVRGGKGLMTDHGTRVPLIAGWAKGTLGDGGRVSDALVDFSDFHPTLGELAGWEPAGDIDGVSLLPVLTGARPQGDREWILCHYNPRPGGVKTGNVDELTAAKKLGRFVRDQRWKLYQDGRFYDLLAWPPEAAPLDPKARAGTPYETFRRVLDELPPWNPLGD